MRQGCACSSCLVRARLALGAVRDGGLTGADARAWPRSVEAKQQGLRTNACCPFELGS